MKENMEYNLLACINSLTKNSMLFNATCNIVDIYSDLIKLPVFSILYQKGMLKV